MKKFLFPFWIIVAYLLDFIVAAWISVDGGLILMVSVLALLPLLVIPIYCILYSRKVLLHEKRKWLFVPYNAVWVTLPYALLLLFANEEETLVYGAILFAWGALWTAVPLLFPPRKQQQALAS